MSNTDPFFKTTPHDHKHFPATNQAHYCWQKYNEFVLCMRKSNGDEDRCQTSRQLAASICPNSWMEEWDEARANGTFVGVQEKKPAASGAH